MRSPQAIYGMLKAGYERRVDTICQRIETEIQSMTFECEFCGMETPLSGKHDTDIGELCLGCTLWYEAFEDGVDYPEDFDYDGDF